MIFLDTTCRGDGAGQQKRFYEDKLGDFDKGPAIRGVMVFLHHPPYTNSTRTGDDIWVQREFVPAFVRARKTLAMCAGHVHAYEHFVKNEKHFIVSGGGGGPRPRLAMGKDRRHPDLFEGPEVRDLHFLRVGPAGEGLNVEAVGLAKGARDFYAMDHFALRWPE
jgi:hypothetical protein